MTLSGIQTRLQTIIKADAVLGSLSVLIEDKETLANEVELVLEQQALCIVIAPASGQNMDTSLTGKTADFLDEIDVCIHRGLVANGSGLTTVSVLDRLIPLLHGAATEAVTTTTRPTATFRCAKHTLVEQNDGSLVRVLTVKLHHRFSDT